MVADGVTVSTDQGRLHGGRAVVTVPIGVLKSRDFVFDPPLPEPHRQLRSTAWR